MDRYQKVEKPKPESPINENEIRITTQGAIRNYITYATTLLQEKHAKEIVLKAMGQAINKTVAIAEIIKKRIPQLHQDTAISSVSITDTWEPIEEGLVPVEMTRHVSMISITFSTRELNNNSPGYQAPHNAEQPKLCSLITRAIAFLTGTGYERGRGGGGRGYARGRGRTGGRSRGGGEIITKSKRERERERERNFTHGNFWKLLEYITLILMSIAISDVSIHVSACPA
ncbi:Alba domain-containing protein [Citrus sinensis]|uniref:Alba domain-containing protein n=1 Tax=Citrus sinensis TaxID=2711 RepID=A0ACB8MHB0_CITSI|nr:Alba domain-containing protein [Citrus sinensis]